MLTNSFTSKAVLCIAALIILASCGNNRLRFQRVTLFEKQELISIEKNSQPAAQNETINREAESSVSLMGKSASKSQAEQGVDETLSESTVSMGTDEQAGDASFPLAASDTLMEFSKGEKVAIALKAERLGRVGSWLINLSFLVILVASIFALFTYGSALVIGAIIGSLFNMAAIVLGIASKSQLYNTKVGSIRANRSIFVGSLLFTILFLYSIIQLAF